MITDQHQAFARSVVALARESGMGNVVLRFQHDSRSRRTIDGEPVPPGKGWEEVTVTWSRRHGVESIIELSLQARHTISEKL